MAYLRWGGSPWYAFSHADGGDGDDAVLVAWHLRGAGASLTAAELLQAGCEGRLERLRACMERSVGAEASAKEAAMKDVDVLAPAVDQFLFDVYNAGKIVMPPDVADRYRDVKRRVDEDLTRSWGEQALDSRGTPLLFAWSAELDGIRRRYPPPRLSRDIRDLMDARALRMLQGEAVSPEQDALELARIGAACEWPTSSAWPRTEGPDP